MVGLLGILLGLAFLVWLAFRGWSIELARNRKFESISLQRRVGRTFGT